VQSAFDLSTANAVRIAGADPQPLERRSGRDSGLQNSFLEARDGPAKVTRGEYRSSQARREDVKLQGSPFIAREPWPRSALALHVAVAQRTAL
jgi:hypothetical protein